MRVVVDVGAILLILVNVLLGWRYGLVRRAIAFAGLFGGVAMATFAGNGISNFFRGQGNPDDLYAAATTYLLCVAAVTLMLEILGALYGDRVRDVLSLVFDRSAGALVGAAVGFFEIAIICLVMLAVGDAPQGGGHLVPSDRAKAANAVRDGLIGARIDSAERFVRDVFSPALPSDLPGHLAEATNK